MPARIIQTEVLVIGASAAGLMCAIEAGKRSRQVTVLNHTNKAGKKILMSGGGRCNFTNLEVSAENFISHSRFSEIARNLQHWQIKPNATEGYRTAEVTPGGIDCDELSSKTMESRKVDRLYFVGEVVDVSGWLGAIIFNGPGHWDGVLAGSYNQTR